MNKTKKVYLVLTMLCAMAVTLSGCKQSTNNNDTEQSADTDSPAQMAQANSLMVSVGDVSFTMMSCLIPCLHDAVCRRPHSRIALGACTVMVIINQ